MHLQYGSKGSLGLNVMTFGTLFAKVISTLRLYVFSCNDLAHYKPCNVTVNMHPQFDDRPNVIYIRVKPN